MVHLREISEDTALFPWNKSTPYPAIEATISVAIALLLGQLTGHSSAGSIAAGAAFTIGFAVFHEALSSTLLSMALLTLGLASATLAGSLCAQWTPLVLLLCVVAALTYGVLTELDPTASWIAQQCGVYVVISSYFANGVHYAVGRTAMVLLGGALQMVVYTVSRWLHRRARRDPGPSMLLQMRTRAAELWQGVRQQRRWTADTVSYVLRLTVTLGLSTGLYRGLHWRNGYWAPMTALLVLKPKWGNTLSRGIARLAGTMVATALCALLVYLHAPLHHWAFFVLIVVTAWACFALQAVNYALFSLFITLYTVYLFAFGGFSERTAADLRLMNTAIGGLLALFVDYLAKQLGPRLLTRTGKPALLGAKSSA